MLKIKINKHKNIEFRQEKENIFINDIAFPWDITKIRENHYHVIKDNKSFEVELVTADYIKKTFLIKVNGILNTIDVQDKFDLLLEKMGINNSTEIIINNVKAPMPGLIIEIKVQQGEEVKIGDTLLILEAMKMENVIKSPGNGTIKLLKVKKGDSVEKNQVLIEF